MNGKTVDPLIARKVVKFQLLYYMTGITIMDMNNMTEKEVMELYTMMVLQKDKEKKDSEKK